MNSCDFDHMTGEETRLLPYGGGGNLICCRRHYEAEMRFRRARIAAGVPFDLPAWETLTTYAQREEGGK